MKDIWNLWHPFLPVDTIEFSFRWQFARLVHRSRHDIAELVLRTFSVLEDTAATSRTEFAMQERARTVVSFVDRGLCLRLLGIGE